MTYIKRLLLMSTFVAGFASQVQAAPMVFTFSDEYYITSLLKFQTVFGATATGYNKAGVYQLTNTAASTVAKLSPETRRYTGRIHSRPYAKRQCWYCLVWHGTRDRLG